MKITVCIGSYCHLRGSGKIVEQLKALIERHGLKDRVELAGKFCMGECKTGPCVTVDGVKFSVQPEETEGFFEREVLAKL